MSEAVKIICVKDKWTKIATAIKAGEVFCRKSKGSGRVLLDYRETEATSTPKIGNAGDGTVTDFALLIAGVATPGIWNLECTGAVVNGGVFKLEDPDGKEVESAITIAPGAGGVIVYSGYGMTFKITDGATDFDVGDIFSLEVFSPEGDSTAEILASYPSKITIVHSANASWFIRPSEDDLVVVVKA